MVSNPIQELIDKAEAAAEALQGVVGSFEVASVLDGKWERLCTELDAALIVVDDAYRNLPDSLPESERRAADESIRALRRRAGDAASARWRRLKRISEDEFRRRMGPDADPKDTGEVDWLAIESSDPIGWAKEWHHLYAGALAADDIVRVAELRRMRQEKLAEMDRQGDALMGQSDDDHIDLATLARLDLAIRFLHSVEQVTETAVQPDQNTTWTRADRIREVYLNHISQEDRRGDVRQRNKAIRDTLRRLYGIADVPANSINSALSLLDKTH